MVRFDDPLEMVGCYSLDLYCDQKNFDHRYDEFPHVYTAEYGSRCRRDARRDGWILHKDHTATCPRCSRKRRSK